MSKVGGFIAALSPKARAMDAYNAYVVYRKGDNNGRAGHGGTEVVIFPQLIDMNSLSVEAADNYLGKENRGWCDCTHSGAVAREWSSSFDSLIFELVLRRWFEFETRTPEFELESNYLFYGPVKRA